MNLVKSDNSAVLYGVPKVAYGIEGCTPYPSCLRACANYLGQDLQYDYLMAASGAGFRFTWNTERWDGGNVEVNFTYDRWDQVYEQGLYATGRAMRMLKRMENTTKEEFIQFITTELDQGYPCIALGIIGPPEACIVTGYKDNGNTLLGWNFFQDYPENGAEVRKDDCGYFITDTWWENEATIALFATGPAACAPPTLKEIIENGITALTGRKFGAYAKGVLAYDAWIKALLDESAYPQKAVMPIQAERMMCHGDAMDCIVDGRGNAGSYIKRIAGDYPVQQTQLEELSGCLDSTHKCILAMMELLGGWERGENQMKKLMLRETREKLAVLAREAKAFDEKALWLMRTVRDCI